MPNHLDIDLLRTLTAIAETGSLSRAAYRVSRTQSALSVQMQRLEAIVGQPLLLRTGRGVVLTRQGERLLMHAQRILRSHDEALAELSGRGLAGTIRFGLPEDYAAEFLPTLLQDFARMHPQVQMEVVCAPSPRLREQLASHALDLAMVSVLAAGGKTQRRVRSAGNQKALAGTTSEPVIRREPLVWVGSGHLPAMMDDALPLALSHPDTLDHIAALEALRAAGRSYRIAYASSSLAGLVALVRSGQAIAVLTQMAVPADLQVLPFSRQLPELPAVGITLEFSRADKAALVAAFAEHIRQALPQI